LVSCGCCQRGCTGRRLPPAYDYYLCRTKTQLRLLVPGGRCPARYIPAKPLEELVWRDLCEVLQHPGIIAHAIERARGGHWLPQEWQARRENLRRGRASLGQQIERLTEAYLGGIVPLAEFERRRETESRLRALERQEQDLLADARDRDETARLADYAGEFCRRVRDGLAKADFERKRALLELLVDRVVVTDGKVEIRYAFPTGPEGERQPFCRLRTDYLHALPRRKLVRQQAPGLAAAQDVEDGIQHQPQVMLARTPAAGCRGQERRQDRPLRIAQVGGIAKGCHTPSDGHNPIYQTPSNPEQGRERSKSS
jgi:site-specific DNA recombinase